MFCHLLPCLLPSISSEKLIRFEIVGHLHIFYIAVRMQLIIPFPTHATAFIFGQNISYFFLNYRFLMQVNGSFTHKHP